MNTFGHNLRLTTFGESHGPAMGGVLDGFPPRFPLDLDKVQRELDLRRPGSPLTSQRKETDRLQVLSGIMDGQTLGTPIGFIIPNTDARSGDYEAMRTLLRPGHADFTTVARYGIRDHRGGGRASARETVSRVAAGAMARQWLEAQGIDVSGFISRIGSACRFSSSDPMDALLSEVEAARREGDSVGGEITIKITGVKAGVGNPVFGKLSAQMGQALLSIPGVKAFEIGDGKEFASRCGSQVLDTFIPNPDGDGIITEANHSGGIQGGISNGMPILLRITLKPTPTLLRSIPTTDISGNPATLHARGRHDPCIALRALPVAEAMACLALMDSMLVFS